MKKYVSIIFILIILSFYFFPFQFRFLPSANTKMIMAGIGLVILGISLSKSRNSLINKDIFVLSILAAVVSLIGLVSVTYNDTFDYTYTTYVISMWVWLSAAYVVIFFMRLVHGSVSVYLLCNYLIALCVGQCVLALLMNFFAPVEQFIYSIIDEGTANFLEKKNRLSGLGVGLDVAGSRFSAVLVMLSFILVKYSNRVIEHIYLYILSFLIISVVGNMIARTTSVGMIMSILYFIIAIRFYELNVFKKRFLFWIITILLVFTPMLIYSYSSIPEMRQNLRFGFEGFFSLWEKGKWEVSSNSILQDMYVFPETLKTWLIGDGYFDSTASDPYYTGKEWKGYYMATDVGYLRFIYYFGLAGLFAFTLFIYNAARICIKRFPSNKMLFIMLLAINFIVWFKVSTDIFLVFALFLCIDKDENDIYIERTLSKI